AEDKSKALEAELFEEVRVYLAQFAEEMQTIAAMLAELDVYQSMAEVAFRNNYVRPKLDTGSVIDIKKARHPVVEKSLAIGEPFIPNDIYLDQKSEQLLMITGPNMAGKSIILRQTGLIVLLAQIGSFVPAQHTHIGLVDKIFTRVGASDNLAAGESTFLVEMNEAANILNNATHQSLILLDEVGRGTSTFDGLSIAWALAEYLHNHAPVAAKTLFATHYHELNALEAMYERIVNYNVQVREHQGKVVFLRTLVRGGADHSYGIQVANMAGLPSTLIQRAQMILQQLESQRLEIEDNSSDQGLSKGISSAKVRKGATDTLTKSIDVMPETEQMSLFAQGIDPSLEELKNKIQAIDPNQLSPMQALLLIDEWKKMLG
ncbi:MAG: DNA mismatch repair protein MutS, partial [Bacteroidota bacterium]